MDRQEQFTRLWTEVQPKLAAYINALVPDFQEAEDLLQDVAVTAMRKFQEYDAHRPFIAWAIGITKREVLMARRRHARTFLIYQADLLDRISEAYEELAPELENRSRVLRECLREVKGRASELLRLRYEDALAPRAIATSVGMAVVAVRVMLSRTRTALRQCIQHKLKTLRQV
jgi:RNA polymerase sigma-70 factor (ECF subfamily)